MTRPGPELGQQEGSGCGILIRLGIGAAEEALPPYCEQPFRGAAQGPQRERRTTRTRGTLGCWARGSGLRPHFRAPWMRCLKPCSELHASLISSSLSSTGVHNRVRVSSPLLPICAWPSRGRVGDQGGAQRWFHPGEPKEGGAWPGRRRGSAPSPRRGEVERKVWGRRGAIPGSLCQPCASVVPQSRG